MLETYSPPWLELTRGSGMWVDDVDDDAYHELPIASRSRLEVLRESPALYWARFLAPEPLADEDTKARRVGRYTHKAVLEPGDWEQRFVREPVWEFDGRTKDGKAERAAWREQNAGRHVVSADEFDLATAMQRAVYTHDTACALLVHADACERVAVWRDRVTGLLCRAKLDAVHYDGRGIFDLKTADDIRPDRFGQEAGRRGYHRQAAMYCDAFEAVTGFMPRFGYVAVHKKPPHEIAVYELDDYALDAARRQYRTSLIDLDRRMAENDWTPSYCREPLTLALPGWALDDR